MQIFLAYVKKKQYFCRRFREERRFLLQSQPSGGMLVKRYSDRKVRRDVGIGRQERLKIFCSVMSVPVRPRLAVQRKPTIWPAFFFSPNFLRNDMLPRQGN